MALFWDKVDFGEYVPLVPTSAITGDGMGDLIALLVDYSSKNLVDTLMLSMEIEAMVMEVGVMHGVVIIMTELNDRSKSLLDWELPLMLSCVMVS